MEIWASFKAKWWISIPSTLFVGALQSGLWDIALKPTSQWGWHLILNTVTLGSQRIKNSVYQEAARGFHEHPSSSSYSLLIMAMIGVLMYFVFRPYLKWRSEKRYEDVLKRLTVTGQMDKEIESAKVELKRLKRQVSFLYPVVAISYLFIMGMQIAEYVKVQAALDANVTFHQTFDICRPYIDEHAALLIISQYASIQTRKDYVGIIEELHGIANYNHLHIPDSVTW